MRDRGEDEATEGSERKNSGTTKVPFFGMFRYADRADLALMAVGTVAAMVNGLAEPLMTVVFAAVIESFGGSDDSTILHRVSKVLLEAAAVRRVLLREREAAAIQFAAWRTRCQLGSRRSAPSARNAWLHVCRGRVCAVTSARRHGAARHDPASAAAGQGMQGVGEHGDRRSAEWRAAGAYFRRVPRTLRG